MNSCMTAVGLAKRVPAPRSGTEQMQTARASGWEQQPALAWHGTHHKAEVDEHMRVLRRLLLSLHHLPLRTWMRAGKMVGRSKCQCGARKQCRTGVANHDWTLPSRLLPYLVVGHEVCDAFFSAASRERMQGYGGRQKRVTGNHSRRRRNRRRPAVLLGRRPSTAPARSQAPLHLECSSSAAPACWEAAASKPPKQSNTPLSAALLTPSSEQTPRQGIG